MPTALRPVNCRATFREQAGSITLAMPPAGVWRGNNTFLVLFTCLWWGALVIFTLGTSSVPAARSQTLPFPYSLLLPIPYLHWLVAIGLMLFILQRACRSAKLTVDGERLLVVQAGLFGVRRQVWPRQEVRKVHVACDRRSAMGEGKSNPYHPWLIDLRVVPRRGRPMNVITYREGDPRKADLEWMATMLQAALTPPVLREGFLPVSAQAAREQFAKVGLGAELNQKGPSK